MRQVPEIDVFVDSPLAVNATAVSECILNVSIKISRCYVKDPDPFGFDNLYYINKVEESKKLNSHKKPCVIISASGMMEAGHVKHHLANNISDRKTQSL